MLHPWLLTAKFEMGKASRASTSSDDNAFGELLLKTSALGATSASSNDDAFGKLLLKTSALGALGELPRRAAFPPSTSAAT